MCISRKIAIVGIALGSLALGYTFVVHGKVRKICKASKEVVIDVSGTADREAVHKLIDEGIKKYVENMKYGKQC